jgi:hypothetical protein
MLGASVLLAFALIGCGSDGEPESGAGPAATPQAPSQGETGDEAPGEAATGSTGAGGTGTVTAGDSATTPLSAEEEARALVSRWYTETDPAVCEEMTDDFLRVVYGAPGAEGREACGRSVTQPPLEGVEVGAAVVEGDRATVEAMYRVNDRDVVDRLGLVQANGRWLLDSYETLPA